LRLSEIISNGNFVRIIELFPPGIPIHPEKERGNHEKLDLSIRFERLIESVQKLESIADGFSLPELKDELRVHLNSVSIASELKRRTGNLVIPTITLRDSNRQNLLGSVAYSIFAGLENLFVVRGDPYSNDRSSIPPKNVFDFVKVSDLVREIRELERLTVSGSKLCILSPIKITKSHDPKYLEIIRHRELAGIDLFVAESFFDDSDSYFSKVKDIRKAGINRPIIHNVFPLRNYEDAILCIEKFGWSISKQELSNLKIGGATFGLEMARKRYHSLLNMGDLANGASISSRGNPDYARQIVS